MIDYCLSKNLELFIKRHGIAQTSTTDVLDLPLASMNIARYINAWKVDEQPSMLDQRLLIFRIEITRPQLEPKRRLKNTNWEVYRKELAAKLVQLNGKYGTTRVLE